MGVKQFMADKLRGMLFRVSQLRGNSVNPNRVFEETLIEYTHGRQDDSTRSFDEREPRALKEDDYQ